MHGKIVKRDVTDPKPKFDGPKEQSQISVDTPNLSNHYQNLELLTDYTFPRNAPTAVSIEKSIQEIARAEGTELSLGVLRTSTAKLFGKSKFELEINDIEKLKNAYEQKDWISATKILNKINEQETSLEKETITKTEGIRRIKVLMAVIDWYTKLPSYPGVTRELSVEQISGIATTISIHQSSDILRSKFMLMRILKRSDSEIPFSKLEHQVNEAWKLMGLEGEMPFYKPNDSTDLPTIDKKDKKPKAPVKLKTPKKPKSSTKKCTDKLSDLSKKKKKSA
ncbi:MAG: hypothetical protein SGI74_12790 [Oligoflexia bacterium]|nr:hypothetical protein [Oligoflexia bacterium]